jgi:hypothetical protein
VRAIGWLLNGKAVAHEALAGRALLERDLADPARRRVAGQLRAVRQQRAALAMTAPATGQEAERTRRLEQMTRQQEDLERQLTEAGGIVRAHKDPWIELEEVRRAVPADAVLIDLVRFQPRVFAAKHGEADWQPARYVAWLVPSLGKMPIRIVDLGLAHPIEAAVKVARDAIQEAQGTPERPGIVQRLGEAESEKALRQPLQVLSKLALEPLRQHAGDTRRWIISPDASLWLVPWAALPLADGSYAIEKYQMDFVTSGRDLVLPWPAKMEANAPIVMADPDFDLGLAEAQAETRRVLRRDLSASNVRAAARSLGAVHWTRLPGTAAEAEAVRPNLERFAQTKPYVYTDTFALEGVLKAFARPKVAVLSTHGFFLVDQETAAQGGNTPSGRESSPTLTKGRKTGREPAAALRPGAGRRQPQADRRQHGRRRADRLGDRRPRPAGH